jgi:hypothetical protein
VKPQTVSERLVPFPSPAGLQQHATQVVVDVGVEVFTRGRLATKLDRLVEFLGFQTETQPVVRKITGLRLVDARTLFKLDGRFEHGHRLALLPFGQGFDSHAEALFSLLDQHLYTPPVR